MCISEPVEVLVCQKFGTNCANLVVYAAWAMPCTVIRVLQSMQVHFCVSVHFQNVLLHALHWSVEAVAALQLKDLE